MREKKAPALRTRAFIDAARDQIRQATEDLRARLDGPQNQTPPPPSAEGHYNEGLARLTAKITLAITASRRGRLTGSVTRTLLDEVRSALAVITALANDEATQRRVLEARIKADHYEDTRARDQAEARADDRERLIMSLHDRALQTIIRTGLTTAAIRPAMRPDVPESARLGSLHGAGQSSQPRPFDEAGVSRPEYLAQPRMNAPITGIGRQE